MQLGSSNNGLCNAAAAPYKYEVTVNGPYQNEVGHNTFRRLGTQYHNVSILKDFSLLREDMRLEFRADFFDIFNHPNFYLNPSSIDVNAHSYNVNSSGGPIVSGVTASFGNPAVLWEGEG